MGGESNLTRPKAFSLVLVIDRSEESSFLSPGNLSGIFPILHTSDRKAGMGPVDTRYENPTAHSGLGLLLGSLDL